MRRYEVTCVLAPTLSPEEVEQAIENFKQAGEERGATLVDLDNWGKRRLAFPVKKHTEGYYVVYTFEEPAAQAIAELERRFKVADQVIRFLTVRVDEDLKRAEKFKEKRGVKKSKREDRRTARAQAESEAVASQPAQAEQAPAPAAPTAEAASKEASDG